MRMLALDVIVVLLILAAFVGLVIFLDKRNRQRAVFKFQMNRHKGAENLEVAQEQKRLMCDRCQKPVNVQIDFYKGDFWRHAACDL